MRVAWRAFVFVLLGLAPAGGTAAAGPASRTTSAPSFEQLVEAGNRARAGRRWAEAVVAYSDALKLRDDLTVVGRLGLVLLELGEHAAAASQLHRALEEPDAGASPAERVQFVMAYDVTRREICRLDVRLDRTGVRVELDGRTVQEGPADFWLFVAAGKHELRARLEGFEEETKEIEAARGGRMPVEFTMKAKATPAAPPAQVEPPPPPAAPQTTPAPEEPAARSVSTNSRGRVVLGAGAAVVLGATPGAAVGPQIFAAWRRGWLSVGLEGRAVWGLGELEGFPDAQVMSWAVGTAPCVHWRWLFGCGLLQLNWLGRDVFSSGEVGPRSTPPRAGVGGRGGIEFVTQKRFGVRLWGDFVIPLSGQAVRTDPFPLWPGSSVAGSLGADALLIF
ncbi:hypothetical protein [Polyangium jinanense]|uniref:PEGA domain-containing protein n=1 Tax=Polyangium jinanense TaxID=2829994 RepID=A0A9X3XHE2_9BACT|nr:hypothetical protein [Polyangium jinanense]MDC3988713.1 hypothetical protein [Polyangium jinanense]